MNSSSSYPRFRRGTSNYHLDQSKPPAFIQARIQGNIDKGLRNQSKVLFHMGPVYSKGVEHMADLTGLTAKQVRLAFTRLEESGQIVLVERPFGAPKVYRRSGICQD